MNYLEAIDIRRSRRTYSGQPVEKATLDKLQVLADRFNLEANLHIQVVEDGSEAFNGITKSYGLFNGVKSLIVLVGNREDEHLKEKLGYYGELLLLEATTMGLGSCWVGGSFDHKCPIVPLGENESLECLITIGYVGHETRKEKFIHNLVVRRPKPMEEFYNSDTGVLPSWIIKGIMAALKAPSAANRQPVRFEYRDHRLMMSVKSVASFELIDLGIAKSHFVLATGCRFEWGSNTLIPSVPIGSQEGEYNRI